MKKVMVIAGGNWQTDLVKKLKEMGHFVVCSNLFEDSPAFRYADAWEVADVKDKEKNLEFAIRHGIDAVVTDQSDIAVPTVAYIAEKLGLPGIGMEKANLCTDKELMRVFCKKNHILVPDYKPCHRPEDALEMLEKYGRIIIKPIDSQSARGVFIIDDEKRLRECFDVSMSYANRRKEILAEEYIGGTEFTIDGLVIKGKYHPLCISYKEMHKKNPMVSIVQRYAGSHPLFDYEELRNQAKRLIESIGIPFGLTHTEYRFDKGRFYLLETAARGGGSNLSSKIVPYMSGIDNYQYLIHSILDEPVDEEALKTHRHPARRYAIMKFFDLGTGEVKAVHGLQEIQGSKYLLDYHLPVKAGDKLEEPRFGSMRPGHFTIAGRDEEELEREYQRISHAVYAEFK